MNDLPITPLTLECIAGNASAADISTDGEFDRRVFLSYSRFTEHCTRCVQCRINLFAAMCRYVSVSFSSNSKGHYLYVGSDLG